MEEVRKEQTESLPNLSRLHSRPLNVDCRLPSAVCTQHHRILTFEACCTARTPGAPPCIRHIEDLPLCSPGPLLRLGKARIAADMRLAPVLPLALAVALAVVGRAAGAAWNRAQTLTDSSKPWWVQFCKSDILSGSMFETCYGPPLHGAHVCCALCTQRCLSFAGAGAFGR